MPVELLDADTSWKNLVPGAFGSAGEMVKREGAIDWVAQQRNRDMRP